MLYEHCSGSAGIRLSENGPIVQNLSFLEIQMGL